MESGHHYTSMCITACDFGKAVICLRSIWHVKQANPMSCLQKQNCAACRSQHPRAFCKHCFPGIYLSNISRQSNWGILLFGVREVSSRVKNMSTKKVASCFPFTPPPNKSMQPPFCFFCRHSSSSVFQTQPQRPHVTFFFTCTPQAEDPARLVSCSSINPLPI